MFLVEEFVSDVSPFCIDQTIDREARAGWCATGEAVTVNPGQELDILVFQTQEPVRIARGVLCDNGGSSAVGQLRIRAAGALLEESGEIEVRSGFPTNAVIPINALIPPGVECRVSFENQSAPALARTIILFLSGWREARYVA